MKIFNKNRGFTLIELLTVIAVIGMLSSIMLSSLNAARAKARDAGRVGQLHELNRALALYYSAHGEYPPPVLRLTWTGSLCMDDPGCLAQSDAIWDGMITALKNEKFLAEKPPVEDSLYDKIAKLILPEALAAPNAVQDPQYPAKRYAYMTAINPLNQNYRLRAELENAGSVYLSAGLTGKFYWSDKTSGGGWGSIDSCDPDLKFYCSGPPNTFESFDPGKPVIYLYPTKTQTVSVKVHTTSIDESIPDYGNGWSVIAHPNGEIINPYDGKSYPYLYWEGRSGKPIIDKTKGFVVVEKDIATFLMDSLLKQGLIAGEAQEFVEYWAPRMTGKPYVYVYFMPQLDYDKLIPMDISPKPDTIIRTYMLWKGLDEKISVTPQKFTAPERFGFTVVEWGGDRSQI